VGKIIAEMGSGKIDESEVQEELDDMLRTEVERERLEKVEREQREMGKKEADKSKVKEDRLVSELKSVSLQSPGDTERKELEEAIAS